MLLEYVLEYLLVINFLSEYKFTQSTSKKVYHEEWSDDECF